jgi:hypothetical protein
MLKVASCVYATSQGLGILAKDYFDNGLVTHPVIIQHGRHDNYPEWYPQGTPVIKDLRRDTMPALDPILRECDVFFAFETPFEWAIFNRCRELGKKSVLMPMFECEFKKLPSRPDLIVNPSLLDQQYYPEGVFIPVPVTYPWRKRERARVFVHNAGHGGLRGRNGTAELVEAMRLVTSPARLRLRAQESSRQYWAAGQLRDANNHPVNLPNNIDLRIGTFPYETLFSEGDVFVFPEKFNGLSLPLQEARAAGMLVMCGDRFPMNTWLPTKVDTSTEANEEYRTFSNPLIPVAGYTRQRVGPPYNEFDEAVFDPRAIAAKIDEWYDKDITEYSLQGKEWAATMSWAALKPRYLDVLQRLVDGKTTPSVSARARI